MCVYILPGTSPQESMTTYCSATTLTLLQCLGVGGGEGRTINTAELYYINRFCIAG